MTAAAGRREPHRIGTAPVTLDLSPRAAGRIGEVLRAALEPGRVIHGEPAHVRDEVWSALIALGEVRDGHRADGEGSGSATPGHAPSEPALHELLGTTAAAGYLAVNPSRVTALARAGRIGHRVGGRWLFTRDELDAYRRGLA